MMPFDPLTDREAEVLQQLITGQRNREIAATLCIGESTVETHLVHIYRKLGVRNRSEAIIVATQRDRLQVRKDQGNP